MGVRIEGVKRESSRGKTRARAAASRDGQPRRLDGKSPPMKTYRPHHEKISVRLAFVLLSSLAAAPLARAQSAAAAPAAATPAPAAPPPLAPALRPRRFPRRRSSRSPARLPLRSAHPPAVLLLPSLLSANALRLSPPPVAAPAVPSRWRGSHTHDGFYMPRARRHQRHRLVVDAGGDQDELLPGGGAVVGHRDWWRHRAKPDPRRRRTSAPTPPNPDKQVAGASVTSDCRRDWRRRDWTGPGLLLRSDPTFYLSATFGLAGFTANDGNGFRVDSSRSGTRARADGRQGVVGLARLGPRHCRGALLTASLKDKNTPGLTWSAGAAVDSLLGDLQLTPARLR